MHLGAVDEIDARVGHRHFHLHVAVIQQEQQGAAGTRPAHRRHARRRFQDRLDAGFGGGGGENPPHRRTIRPSRDVDRPALAKPVAGNRWASVQSRADEVREHLGAGRDDELTPDIAL